MAAECTICSAQVSGRSQAVRRGVEATRAAAVLEGEARPLDGVAAVAVEVPAAAAAVVPDGTCEPFLDLRVVGVLGLGVHVELGSAPLVHGAQGIERVVRLRLQHVDDRAVTEVQVRTVEEEEVRKAANGCAEVRL